MNDIFKALINKILDNQEAGKLLLSYLLSCFREQFYICICSVEEESRKIVVFLFSFLTHIFLNFKAARALHSGDCIDVMAMDADNCKDNSLAVLYLDHVISTFNRDPLIGKIHKSSVYETEVI